MRKAIVELEDYQVRTLIKFAELSDNPSDEDLGHALMEFLDSYSNVIDDLSEEYDETIDE